MVALVSTLEVSEPNADSAIPPPKAEPIPPLWLFCIKTKNKTEIKIKTKVNKLIIMHSWIKKIHLKMK